MLTRKQLELLDFIKTRMDADGVPPSFDEMKEALDLRSKSGIHRLITALEERGFIRRLAHRARALEIVKLPEAMEKAGFKPRIVASTPAPAAPPRNAMPVEAAHALEKAELIEAMEANHLVCQIDGRMKGQRAAAEANSRPIRPQPMMPKRISFMA